MTRLPVSIALLEFECGVLDFVLDVPSLDGAQGAAHSFDALDVLQRLALDLVRQRFDVVAAAHRIDSIRHPAFVAR